MGDQDKSLKLNIAIDEASFRRAQNELKQLTAEIQRAIEASTRLTGGMGGQGGGGMANTMMHSILGTAAPTPQSSVQSAQAINQPGQANVKVGGLADTVQAARSMFKGMTEQGRDSMRSMSDALKQSVDNQVRDIDRLKSAIDRLMGAYGQISGGGGPRMLGAGGPGEMQLSGGNALMPAGSMPMGLQRLNVLGGGGGAMLPPYQMGPGGGAAPGGAAWGPYPPTPGGSGNPTLFRGSPGGLLKGYGLLAGASMIASAAWQAPQMFVKQDAMLSAMVRPEMMAMRGGDISLIHAMDQLKIHGSDLDNMSTLSRSNAPYAQAIMKNIQSIATLQGVDLNSLDAEPIRKQAVLSYLKNASQSMQPGEGLFGRGVGYDTMMLGEFQSSAMSRVGAMRGLRMGGVSIDQHGRTRGAMGVVERAQAKGFGQEEVVAAFQSLATMGGDRFGHAYQGAVLSAQAGGLTAAGQVLGVSAQAGGGVGAYNQLQNMIGGRGGLDVNAANILGGAFAGGMMDQSAMTSGTGFMAALGNAASGAQGAQQLRVANQVAAGLAPLGGLMQGRVDPYQSGYNLLAAIHAMPHAGVMAQEFLSSKMTPRMMFDILGGANIPSELKKRGITSQAAVQTYARDVLNSVFNRAVYTADDPRRGFAKGVMGHGGDVRAYIKQQVKSGASQQDLIETFGTILEDTEIAPNNESAQGMARDIVKGMGASATTKRLRGHGAGDSAANSLELQTVAAQMSKNLQELNKDLAQFGGEIKKEYQKIPQGMNVLGKFAEVGTSAENATRALFGLAMAADQASARLDPEGRAEQRRQQLAKIAGSDKDFKAAMKNPNISARDKDLLQDMHNTLETAHKGYAAGFANK